MGLHRPSLMGRKREDRGTCEAAIGRGQKTVLVMLAWQEGENCCFKGNKNKNEFEKLQS